MIVMLPETTTSEQANTVKSIPIDSVDNAKIVTEGNMCTNVLKDCYNVIARKRTGNGRKIVYLILVIVGLSQALDFGMTVITFYMNDRLVDIIANNIVSYRVRKRILFRSYEIELGGP